MFDLIVSTRLRKRNFDSALEPAEQCLSRKKKKTTELIENEYQEDLNPLSRKPLQ